MNLNDIEVSACDISSAYLNAPVGEKVWFVARVAMGKLQGMAMITTRALYGLTPSIKAQSKFFGKALKERKYTPCAADPDVQMKPLINKVGYTYCSYMLVFVDDRLAIHYDPGLVMDDLKFC